MNKDDVFLVTKYESEILDICYHLDDFTTSDLQGAIEAQLYQLVNEVRKNTLCLNKTT
jgi:hypothetical protein